MNCPYCNTEMMPANWYPPQTIEDGDVLIRRFYFWCPECEEIRCYKEIFHMTDYGWI